MMRTIKFALFCLFLLPIQASAEQQGKAKIITGFNQAARCIAPVQILKIDGREVNVQKLTFDLVPGRHTMSGRALIDTSFCQTVGRATNRSSVPPLVDVFEAGKTYWIGFDHSSSDRKDWNYVIWKVKD